MLLYEPAFQWNITLVQYNYEKEGLSRLRVTALDRCFARIVEMMMKYFAIDKES